MGMLDRAYCQRSCLPRVFLPALVRSHNRRPAGASHLVDRAEPSVADRARKFPGAVDPDWNSSKSRIVVQPNSRDLAAPMDRKNFLQPLYLATAIPRDDSASAPARKAAGIPAEHRGSIRLCRRQLLPARAAAGGDRPFNVERAQVSANPDLRSCRAGRVDQAVNSTA